MGIQTQSETHPFPIEAAAAFTWHDIFSEGEKRIQQKFLDVVLLTPTRDRARLLAQRDAVKRKIAEALAKDNARKLTHAIREQTKLLAQVQRAFEKGKK